MELSITSLIPERVPFRLADGSEIYFRTMRDFTIQEKIEWTKIRKDIDNTRKQKDKAKGDKQLLSIEKKSLSAYIDLIEFALPACKDIDFFIPLPEDLKAEDIPKYWKGLVFGQIDQLASYCLRVVTGMYVKEDVLDAIRKAYPMLPEVVVQGLSPEQAAALVGHSETEEYKKQLKNWAGQLSKS